MKTVAVFFGGKSNEHEISVITGMLAVNLLRGSSVRVLPVYLPRGGGMCLANVNGVEEFRVPDPKKFIPAVLCGKELLRAGKRKKLGKIDCALNCCHGGMGEDGTLSALLKWNGIANASPDTPVSAVFMSKELGKIAARGLGIPVARAFAVSEREWKEDEAALLKRAEAFGYPVIVKPSRLGSSIGIKVAKNKEELRQAFLLSFRLDDGALVEEYFEEKRDINCAAYRKEGKVQISACEEVFSDEAILSFSEKYEGTCARKSQLPADLPEEISRKIQEYTGILYESFGVRGVVRADFLVAGGSVYFNELNTVPGSLACYLFGESLTKSRRFLVSLVEEALACGQSDKETVQTGILNSNIFSGGKSCKRGI